MYLEDSTQSRKKILIGRVREIIDISYKILIQKIGNGTINAWNEASFQLEFGSILKTVGNLYEFSTAEQYSLDTSDFDFRQGSIYKKGTSLIYNTQKPYGAEIVLDSDYEFKWQEIGNFYFLKLEV